MKSFNDYIHKIREEPPLPDGRAVVKNRFDIRKSDTERMQVFGWASIAALAGGELIEDFQGDVIEPDDLEQAAYEFVRLYGDGGEMHEPSKRVVMKLIESVVFTPEKLSAIGIPEGSLPTGWWIGFQVMDPDVWQKIKDGSYSMFSIEGTGERIEIGGQGKEGGANGDKA